MSLMTLALLVFAIAIMTCYVVDRSGSILVVRVITSRSLAMHRQLAGGSNRLFLQGLNTPENCVTPLSVADALIMFCVFDLSRGPVQIMVQLPEDRYWSIACYSTDTTNFFSVNSTNPEVSCARTATLFLSCSRDSQSHPDPLNPPECTADKLLIVDSASRHGLVLIRVVVNKPEDTEEVESVGAALKLSTTAIWQSSPSAWESFPCSFAGQT